MSKALIPFQEFKINSEEQEIPKISYETDLTTVYPRLIPMNGATEVASGIQVNAVNESCNSHFYMDDYIDPGRVIVLTWTFYRVDANADTIDFNLTITKQAVTGVGASITIEGNTAIVIPACNNLFKVKYSYTIVAADVTANYDYATQMVLNEAGRDLSIATFTVRYYQKRSLT